MAKRVEMVIRTCEHCQGKFIVPPCAIRERAARFCDWACLLAFYEPSAQLQRMVDRSGGPDACWPWTGSRDKDGYGLLWHKNKRFHAHKVAWEHAYEQAVPDDLVTRHRCPGGGNAACCNPKHLRLGTPAETVTTLPRTPIACLMCNRTCAVEVGDVVQAIPGRMAPRNGRCPDCGGNLYRDEGAADRVVIATPLTDEEAHPRRGRPPRSKLGAPAEPQPEVPAPCRACRLVPARDASHRLCWTCEAARKRERQQRWLENGGGRHACADCGSAVYTTSRRCKPCDTRVRRAALDRFVAFMDARGEATAQEVVAVLGCSVNDVRRFAQKARSAGVAILSPRATGNGRYRREAS